MAENKPSPEELLKEALEENKKLAADLKKSQASEKKALEAADKSAADRETEVNALKSQIGSLNGIIAELNQTIQQKDEQGKHAGKRPVFKVGKETYGLRIPNFIHNFNGERIEVNAKVLEGNPELLADLVKRGSGALVKKGGK
jgi:TolA-binding protein